MDTKQLQRIVINALEDVKAVDIDEVRQQAAAAQAAHEAGEHGGAAEASEADNNGNA